MSAPPLLHETGWPEVPLRGLFEFCGGGTPSKDRPDFWSGTIPWVSPKDMKSPIVADTQDKITQSAVRESATRLVPPSSVLLVVRSGILKHTIPTALSGVEVALNQDMKALVARRELDQRYYRYFIDGHQPALLSMWRKLGATVESLETERVKATKVPFPPLLTQKAIADFLDRKTAAIDGLIAKKQRLLDLLAEKRAALINQAMTKGLAPSVPMKHSGIPWLGEIPAHWGVGQLRRWLTLQRGVDITKAEQVVGEVPVVSSGGVSSYHDTPYARGPGVVVGRKGSAGTVHFVETDYWPHDTTLWVKDFKGSLPRFVYYKLQNMRLESYDTGSANPTVNRNLVHPVPVAWPPPDEQRTIVARLDSVGEAQARLESSLQRGVERLREYRQALITAAVTGQLDITEEAA